MFFVCLFFDPSPKVKAKLKKYGLIKLERFCTAKGTTDKMQRQPTEWDKIFANDMIDKGFCLHKQLMQINIKEQPHTNEKVGIRTEGTFFQRRNANDQ